MDSERDIVPDLETVRVLFPCAGVEGVNACDDEDVGHFAWGAVQSMCPNCRVVWYALKLSDAVEDVSNG